MKEIFYKTTNSIILTSIIALIVGLLMIFNPFEATISLALFIGIMLVAHSIISIVDMIILRKDAKEINKVLSDELKKASK